MKKRSIQKSIDISAPKEIVWDVLLQDKFTRLWYAAFSEGARAETDWQVGSKAVFTDNSGSGLIGTIVANQPFEWLSVEYHGLVNDGVEEYESVEAQQMKGTRESYRLEEKGGVTRLSIESEVSEGLFQTMSKAWEKALLQIKDLSQAQLSIPSANS
jgi:uncharacterized protein YndB with AHSA1/START domain